MTAYNSKTKIYGSVVGIGCLILLGACQPSSPPVQKVNLQVPAQVTPAIASEQGDELDIVGVLIDQVEEKQLKQKEEAVSLAIRPAAPLSLVDERSRLAEEALNAALGLLKTKQPQPLLPAYPFNLPEKTKVTLRIGVFAAFLT